MANIFNLNNIRKTIRYMQKNGVSDAFYAAKERVELKKQNPYVYVLPSEEELHEQLQEVCPDSKFDAEDLDDLGDLAGYEALTQDNTIIDENAVTEDNTATEENAVKWPLITLVMPAYETNPEYLRTAIDSCIAQSYPYWELVIADASESDCVKNVVEKYSLNGKKIKYISVPENKGIAENTNVGIKEASGEYIGFLDHDDILTPDALYHMVKAAIAGGDKTTIVYSDEDKTDEVRSKYFDWNRKYDFNYDLLLTNNYICHLMLINREKLGVIRLRGRFNGAQDYDLILQIVRKLIMADGISEAKLGEYILHVPKVLYHWRCHSQSTAANTASKQYAYEAGLKALQEHVGILYDVEKVRHSKHLGFYVVEWGKNWNELMLARTSVGAVIGRKVDKKGNMKPILLNEEGEWIYSGINNHYAGELNRFDCAQDVYAADIRYMMMNKKVRMLFKEFLANKGISTDEVLATLTTEQKNIERKDGTVLYIKDLSMQFAALLHEQGYLLMYDPEG